MRANGWGLAAAASARWRAEALRSERVREDHREASGLCRVASPRRWRLLFIATALRTCAPMLGLRRLVGPRSAWCSAELRSCAGCPW